MRIRTGLVLFATVLSTGCGGCSDSATPPTTTAAAPAASSPSGSIPQVAAPEQSRLFGAPAPTAEQRNKLFDLRRDLQAIAAGERTAVDDFASGLLGISDPAPDPRLTRGIAQATQRALAGKSLNDASAERLAMAFYASLYSATMSPDQRRGLRAELTAALQQAGAAPDRVAAAASAALPAN